ncbi:MAG: patatin [Phycisphaerales bacterium]|nr:patatin [Phycisphaerales bacterium]
MAKKRRPVRILAIDGGGIRGILPAQVLVALEEKLRDLDGNPDGRLADYFDFMAGTSTGGILTCLYLCPGENGRPKFSAEEAAGLYLKRGGAIFDVTLWRKTWTVGGMGNASYPAGPIEKSLNDYFDQTKLSELLRPCLVPAYDIQRRRPHFFTQRDAVEKGAGWDFYAKDVCRATSAAPTFFEVARVSSRSRVPYPLIDGGVFANNPALCAYAEARQLDFDEIQKPTAKQMVVLSLGTGVIEKSYEYDQAKDWGAIGWIRPVLDIMMTGVAETVDYQLGRMFDAVGAAGQYVRINPALEDASPEMDDASPENLERLRAAGTSAAVENDDKLNDVARMLVP